MMPYFFTLTGTSRKPWLAWTAWPNWTARELLSYLSLSVFFHGCAQGRDGTPGAQGPPGSDGTPGQNGDVGPSGSDGPPVSQKLPLPSL